LDVCVDIILVKIFCLVCLVLFKTGLGCVSGSLLDAEGNMECDCGSVERGEKLVGEICVVRIPDGLCPAPTQARPDELPMKTLVEHVAVSAPSGEELLAQKHEMALASSCPLLSKIKVDLAPFHSKTLVGSHRQELLMDRKGKVHWRSGLFLVVTALE
jgi:hypothetical protein